MSLFSRNTPECTILHLKLQNNFPSVSLGDPSVSAEAAFSCTFPLIAVGILSQPWNVTSGDQGCVNLGLLSDA